MCYYYVYTLFGFNFRSHTSRVILRNARTKSGMYVIALKEQSHILVLKSIFR